METIKDIREKTLDACRVNYKKIIDLKEQMYKTEQLFIQKQKEVELIKQEFKELVNITKQFVSIDQDELDKFLNI